MFNEILLVKQFIEDVGFLQFNQIETNIFECEGDESWFSGRTDIDNFFRYLQKSDVDLLLATSQKDIPEAPRKYREMTDLEAEQGSEVERWEGF